MLLFSAAASEQGYNRGIGRPFSGRNSREAEAALGGLLTRDESSSAYAIIRHNVRTYESGGVVQVTRGKSAAETTAKDYETSQSSEDRHAGWRYFIEKTGIKPGTNPAEATHKRQAELEQREQKALDDLDSAPKPH